MFRQYDRQKESYKDSVLLFRMGDFYEMFKSDAIEISRLLNLTLTQRQGVPMCGIPYYAVDNYIARLLEHGKKIAICEQVEMPKGKGLAKREVVEVVTPGTIINVSHLDNRTNNYLAALVGNGKNTSLAYVDLSTGEFRATVLAENSEKELLRREIARTNPREVIIQEVLLESDKYSFLGDLDVVLDCQPDWVFDLRQSRERLLKQFQTANLKAFGIDDEEPSILAAGAILNYLDDKHKGVLPHIRSIEIFDESSALGLDESTIRNLEIVKNLHDGGSSFTLLETLDHTKTSLGARKLRRRILQPFPELASIVLHHERVEKLYRSQTTLAKLRDLLSGILDIERLSARIAMDKAHAKDLIAVRDSLTGAFGIRDIVEDSLLDDGRGDLEALFSLLFTLAEMFDKSLMEEPSILLTEGRLIKEGWDSKLDEMRRKNDSGEKILKDYAAEEKAASGINSIKLKYNRIIGYFFEVRKGQADRVPERFRRRQSLAQCERFTTEKLGELEAEINSIKERIIEYEQELFLSIREEAKKHVSELLRLAGIISDIDVVQAFSHAATEYGYVRPRMIEDSRIEIERGRHPIVECHIPHGSFVPNSISIDSDGVSFALITGPNMAGKSTILRQVALITLMAHAGSFVPADSALIGLVDRIYCRVGATDNLARGESTFLVEMNETANILRSASKQSLVIMDEIGRGTGTADGLAIAKAVCEYLLTQTTPKTLFATHYRELTKIEHPHLINLSMAVHEKDGLLIFPKTLVPGPAEASYGIHVGSMAGLPESVVRRAQELLLSQEARSSTETTRKAVQISLFDNREMILEKLRDLELDNLTPMESLQILARWQKELNLVS
ncbi:DNA mismatch repair protein MutS [Olavius algarvensis spirochete endosymbiont]|uniref:DNA mismatch repair protein MutS n=1 Tax=Olavius algarvensis spirochete endosymbiont TaxID=260710 RepID=UPI000F519ED2|nr:DNA mismatch repair protein MutS [Olavius algarvensis spirochete endosymbiont]